MITFLDGCQMEKSFCLQAIVLEALMPGLSMSMKESPGVLLCWCGGI